ncbi:hypothetical protein CAAN1_15S01596 [[Candida] anglica]|uniref:Stress response RCI peptide n=1 Tax=[Candida] anglica TaxID=148631 RepID=A0ABP0ECC3_9ASCO
MCLCLSDLCLVLLSVFFPPLPVWIRRGVCSGDSLINILLCILGYVPGLIHSWYIIAKYPPYSTRSESKIYYIYRNSNDLEAGRGNGNHSDRHRCDHNSPIINEQPRPISSMEAGPSSSYGAINENTPVAAAPPAYSELDNKVQR